MASFHIFLYLQKIRNTLGRRGVVKQLKNRGQSKQETFQAQMDGSSGGICLWLRFLISSKNEIKRN
jgi:hypothetical protein